MDFDIKRKEEIKVKESRRLKVTKPTYTSKGWGNEQLITNGEYCGKILNFNSKSLLSSHFHKLKDEHFSVLSGRFIIRGIDPDTAEKYEFEIKENDIIHIPPCYIHQLECISENGGKILEFSTHHEDSDSYRVSPGDSQKPKNTPVSAWINTDIGEKFYLKVCNECGEEKIISQNKLTCPKCEKIKEDFDVNTALEYMKNHQIVYLDMIDGKYKVFIEFGLGQCFAETYSKVCLTNWNETIKVTCDQFRNRYKDCLFTL